MALLVEIAHPGHPTLHVLLRALRTAHCLLPRGFGHSVEIEKLTHVAAPSDAFMILSRSSGYMTFEPATVGHSWSCIGINMSGDIPRDVTFVTTSWRTRCNVRMPANIYA